MNLKNSLNTSDNSCADFPETQMKKGRNLFICEGITARSINVLTTGAFLSGFIKLLGAADSFNGIIGAIPTIAGVVQLLSPIFLERLRRRKTLVAVLSFVHRILLSLMFFVPLFVKDTSTRFSIIIIVSIISYCSLAFMTPAASNWMVSLTDSKVRGRYFGKRDSFLLAISTILSLAVGKVLDIYRNNNMEYYGFIIIAFILIALTCANTGFVTRIPEPEVKLTHSIPKLKDIITKPMRDNGFRKVVIITVLWNIALQVGAAFFSVYMVSGLDLPYSYITIMTTFGSLIAVVFARLYGKLADKTSWEFVTMVCIGVLSMCHLMWALTNKSNVYYLLPFSQFLSGAAWGGINIAIFNIQFRYAPEEGRTMYIGFNAAVGGVIGFTVAMIGARIVSVLDGVTFSIGNMTFGNMQTVFGISAIMLFICAVSIKILFRKEICSIKMFFYEFKHTLIR